MVVSTLVMNMAHGLANKRRGRVLRRRTECGVKNLLKGELEKNRSYRAPINDLGEEILQGRSIYSTALGYGRLEFFETDDECWSIGNLYATLYRKHSAFSDVFPSSDASLYLISLDRLYKVAAIFNKYAVHTSIRPENVGVERVLDARSGELVSWPVLLNVGKARPNTDPVEADESVLEGVYPKVTLSLVSACIHEAAETAVKIWNIRGAAYDALRELSVGALARVPKHVRVDIDRWAVGVIGLEGIAPGFLPTSFSLNPNIRSIIDTVTGDVKLTLANIATAEATLNRVCQSYELISVGETYMQAVRESLEKRQADAVDADVDMEKSMELASDQGAATQSAGNGPAVAAPLVGASSGSAIAPQDAPVQARVEEYRKCLRQCFGSLIGRGFLDRMDTPPPGEDVFAKSAAASTSAPASTVTDTPKAKAKPGRKPKSGLNAQRQKAKARQQEQYETPVDAFRRKLKIAGYESYLVWGVK